MIVSVFDPGGHTGFLHAEIFDDNTFKLLEYGYFFESDRVDDLIKVSDLVVSERITLSGVKGFNPVGIEVMGAIKQYCRFYNVPLQWQSPSFMQAALRWGVVDPKEFKSEHPKDALCHFVMFLRRSERLPDPKAEGVSFSVKGVPYYKGDKTQFNPLIR